MTCGIPGVGGQKRSPTMRCGVPGVGADGGGGGGWVQQPVLHPRRQLRDVHIHLHTDKHIMSISEMTVVSLQY